MRRGESGPRGRTRLRPLVTGLALAASVAPPGAHARDADVSGAGPIRAALLALDAAPLVPGAAAAVDAPGTPVEPRTLCAPRRCDDVPAVQGVARKGRTGALLLGAALGAASGALLSREAGPGGFRRLERAPVWDGAFVGGGVFGWQGRRFVLDHDEPELGRGRFTDCAPDGSDPLDGADAFFRRTLAGGQAATREALERKLKRRDAMDRLSYLTLGAAVAQPLAMVAAGDAPGRGRDGWALAGSLALAGGLTELAKHAFHRPRPFAHYCEPLDGQALAGDDSGLSFFSGHASLAFAAATAHWRMARMRGYRHAGWIKGGGLALATATAALRMAADKHYFTDVLVGAAIGWAAGFLATQAHAPDAPVAPLSGAGALAGEAPAASAGGLTLGFTWRF